MRWFLIPFVMWPLWCEVVSHSLCDVAVWCEVVTLPVYDVGPVV